jgi:hypothetical protein
MAVCLEYQSVYYSRRQSIATTRLQIVLVVLLLLTLSCKVWIKIMSTDFGYQLARSRQKTVALDMERRESELELSVLSRADNLSQLAKKRLGLVQLSPKQAWKVLY